MGEIIGRDSGIQIMKIKAVHYCYLIVNFFLPCMYYIKWEMAAYYKGGKIEPPSESPS